MSILPTEPAIAVEEIATARRYADASRAASTQRAYASDWRRFSVWCLARQLETLPADPRVVAVFLAAEAELGAAPLTIGRRLTAIGWMHRRAGLQPPQSREGAAAIIEVIAGNRLRNLRAFCQRCHMLHDRTHHLAQRWITYRRRWALGDFFLGPYPRSAAGAVVQCVEDCGR